MGSHLEFAVAEIFDGGAGAGSAPADELVASLRVAKAALGNQTLADAVSHAIEEVQRGQALSRSLASNPLLFPPSVIEMISVAEETGRPVGELPWEAPYLPIDPKDVGRTYEAVIRVNSQSGKGGVAYILKADHKLDLPRRLQIEFSRAVQQHTDDSGKEMSPDDIWQAFKAEYLDRETPLKLNSVHTSSAAGEKDALAVNVYVDGEMRSLEGTGNGPIAAFVAALNDLAHDEQAKGNPMFADRDDIRVLDYHEHALSSGGDAVAAAYVECAVGDQILWGVGIDPNIVTASLKAVISAVNRA